jgi:hypothetical protein
MLALVRVGVVRIEPRLGEKERNLELVLARLEEAAQDLIPSPGEYELRLFDARRPELLRALAEPPVVST